MCKEVFASTSPDDHPMYWSFRFAAALAFLALLLVAADVLVRYVADWKRRRKAQGGVYGVVIDRFAQVIGTYVDPLQTPRRSSRVHPPGSVWTGSAVEDPMGWAWEGQGATEGEALRAALRLRNLYLNLLPELRDSMFGLDDPGGAESSPWS